MIIPILTPYYRRNNLISKPISNSFILFLFSFMNTPSLKNVYKHDKIKKI